MDKNIESILKQALVNLKNKNRFRIKGKCLNDGDLAYLIEGQTSESEREKFLEHILSCQKCTIKLKEHLLVLNTIAKTGMLDTPETVVQAAMNLFSPEVGPNILEIVLNFKEKVIELIRTTGEVFQGPQLIPVPVLRSQDYGNQFTNEIKIVKEFDSILTEVGFEKNKPGICDVEIRLTEKETKKKMQGLRVTLSKNGKEIESSLVEGGKVVFRDMKPDKYCVSIIREDKKLGIIDISITSPTTPK